MTLPEMAAQARQAWKEINPEVYREMVENQELEACSEAAARLTKREMDTLMTGTAMTEAEAWEASRHLFIFPTAKRLREDYNP